MKHIIICFIFIYSNIIFIKRNILLGTLLVGVLILVGVNIIKYKISLNGYLIFRYYLFYLKRKDYIFYIIRSNYI